MTTQNTQAITGKVIATPTIGYSRGGKAVVNIPIQKAHATREGGKLVYGEPDNFDGHIWQPDNLGTSKAEQWARDVVDKLPAGCFAVGTGQIKSEREVTRRDGSTMKVQDVTLYSIGEDLRYGPFKAHERAADPIADATAALANGGLVGSDGGAGLV